MAADGTRSAANELRELLGAFEEYLADAMLWSREKMQTYRRAFARHGVSGRTANDLIAAASAKLEEADRG